MAFRANPRGQAEIFAVSLVFSRPFRAPSDYSQSRRNFFNLTPWICPDPVDLPLGSRNWRLVAEFAGASSWLLGEVGTEERLAEMIRSTGIEVRQKTIPAEIFDSLTVLGKTRRLVAAQA